MKQLLKLGLPRSSRFTLALLLSVLQGLSALALLLTSAWLLARAAEAPAMMYLSLAVVGVRTFALARAALRYAERWLSHDAILGSQAELRGRIYRSLLGMVPGKQKLNLGELSSRVIQDVDELPNLPLRVVLPFVQSIAVSVLSVILFVVLLPSFAIWLALALTLAFVLSLPVASSIARFADRAAAEDRASMNELTNSLVRASTLIANLNWQTDLLQRMEIVDKRISRRALQTARAAGVGQAIFGFAGQASAVLAAILGLQQLQQSHSSSLVMLAVYALAPLGIFDVASGASSIVSTWRRYVASARRIEGLLAHEPVNDVEVAARTEQIKTLELRDVQLGYDHVVLEGLSMKLRASKPAALVGPSGSGKSTIALAFAGFLPISSGQFLCNGEPVVQPESMRSRIGYLEQTPSILAGTVRQNLLLARPDATDEQLVEVLRRVALWKMFEARTGLDTQLGESGALISGGEGQRLSMARALLADFDVILLDEPGANLAFKQAKTLVGDLLKVARERKRIVLLITHDMRLARLTDEIYSLD